MSDVRRDTQKIASYLPDKSLSILQTLSAGQWCSGEELGQALGVSRTAIAKHMGNLSALGLDIERAVGQGYRLSGGLELLDVDALTSAVIDVHYFHNIDSTNVFLLERVRAAKAFHGHLCISEKQDAGRGRRGRAWHSPFAKNLYMSLSWSFTGGVSSLEGLSLVVGIAIARVLQRMSVDAVSLKWPNDVLVHEKKLGGVLVELGGDLSGDCAAIVGIGLNIDMTASDVAAAIDQPWVSLSQLGYRLSRNEVLQALVVELHGILASYEDDRFSSYQAEWCQLNAHADQRVQLVSGGSSIEGIMCGVSRTGAVVLDVEGKTSEHVGGELSLRVLS